MPRTTRRSRRSKAKDRSTQKMWIPWRTCRVIASILDKEGLQMAGIGGDFLSDLVAVSKVAAVDGRRARVAAYIKTAVIKVTPGANGQMIVNMNGRDYAVRDADAAAFRKE